MEIKAVLDQVGLSDGEQKVYLALLELGETTSGPIAEKSGVSASKVYQVTERLIRKGLAGESIKKGTKQFTAAHPRAILDYLHEQKRMIDTVEEEAKNILPQLEATYKEQRQETIVTLSRGMKSVHNTFYGMIDELQKGEDYKVIGGSMGVQSLPKLKAFFTHYHAERARRGIHAKLLLQSTTPVLDEMERKAEHRFLPPSFKNPLQINVHKETTALLLMQEEPIIFTIRNKQVAEGFTQYFEQLWEQRVQLLSGKEGLAVTVEEVLASGKELYLIGAHGLIVERHPALFDRLAEGMHERGLQRHHLSRESTRGSDFNMRGLVEVDYLPEAMLGPLVIWVFGDVVINAIWREELTLVRIEDKDMAADYRAYFRFLREFARKPLKSAQRSRKKYAGVAKQ